MTITQRDTVTAYVVSVFGAEAPALRTYQCVITAHRVAATEQYPNGNLSPYSRRYSRSGFDNGFSRTPAEAWQRFLANEQRTLDNLHVNARIIATRIATAEQTLSALIAAEPPPVAWRIVGTDERDSETAEPLYWSNAHGWTTKAEADVFEDKDCVTANLPIGGAWERS